MSWVGECERVHRDDMGASECVRRQVMGVRTQG